MPLFNEAREQDNVTSDDKDKEEDMEGDGPQFQGEPKPDLSDATSLITPPPDKLDLQTRKDMLNADQRKVFDKLRYHFLHQKDNASVKSNRFTCLLVVWVVIPHQRAA